MADKGLEKLNIQWFPGHMTKAGRCNLDCHV